MTLYRYMHGYPSRTQQSSANGEDGAFGVLPDQVKLRNWAAGGRMFRNAQEAAGRLMRMDAAQQMDIERGSRAGGE